MGNEKLIKRAFIYCVALSLYLCLAQITGQLLLILLACGLFLVLSAWATNKNIAVPILLYFLPWATILKLSPSGTSFYTLALIIVCVLKPHITIKKKNLLVAVVIAVLTMISKIIYGLSVSNSYLLFLLLLVVFPVLTKEQEKTYEFNVLVTFFSIGIIVAAITAQRFISYTNMSAYIVNAGYRNITRLAGYYGDPNFYSAHITAAISGIFVLISGEKNRKKILGMTVAAAILIYCGLLSASKSFAIIAFVTVIIWMILTFTRKGNYRIKLFLIIAIAGLILLMSTSSALQTLISTLIRRFDNADTLSGLTTGRTDLWLNYIKELGSDAYLLFMGKGFSSVLVNGTASHNTLLQSVFQFGLIGTAVIIFWFKNYCKSVVPKIDIINIQVMLLLVGCIGPWMALDMVFFDEFFIMPLFVLCGIKYMQKHQS